MGPLVKFNRYQVELSGFQGPMDLLLYLIQKDEIDIYDIPISHITDQFIKHIEIIQMVSLDQAGEFMAMAATLLVIKMKMLMPRHADDDDEAVEEGWVGPEDFERFDWMTPLMDSRYLTREEIADAIVFLACDKSSFMTGHALVIDGGECI